MNSPLGILYEKLVRTGIVNETRFDIRSQLIYKAMTAFESPGLIELDSDGVHEILEDLQKLQPTQDQVDASRSSSTDRFTPLKSSSVARPASPPSA